MCVYIVCQNQLSTANNLRDIMISVHLHYGIDHLPFECQYHILCLIGHFLGALGKAKTNNIKIIINFTKSIKHLVY